METQTQSSSPKLRIDPGRSRPRSVWRQEWVETERGLVLGFRRDSALVGHLFFSSVVVLAGALFELLPTDWIVVTICLTFLLACEMFRQAIRQLCDRVPFPTPDENQPPPAGVGPLQEIAGMLRGAMTLATIGVCITLAIVFWQRFVLMFGR